MFTHCKVIKLIVFDIFQEVLLDCLKEFKYKQLLHEISFCFTKVLKNCYCILYTHANKKSWHFVEFHLIVQNLTLIHCNFIDYIQTKFIEYILVLADNTTSLFHQSDPSLHIYIVLM